MFINQKRIHQLNNGQASSGPVIYWMSREQRVHDNWGVAPRKESGRKRPALDCRLLFGNLFSRGHFEAL